MLRSRWLSWLFRIRTRLLLVNALIVGVPLLGIVFARFYEREMLASLEQDMVNQAELVRQLVAADPGGPWLRERGPALAAAAKQTRTRIRLLDRGAVLVADSHAEGPPEGPEEPPPSLTRLTQLGARDEAPLAEKPAPIDFSVRNEVKQALAGRYGAATRFWEDRDTLYLFSALPILANGRVEGVVYVTRSTNPVRATMYRLRSTLLLTLLGALGTTTILSLFLAGTISRPLTHLTRVAERIAGGDRTERLALDRADEIGQLARAFDRMEQRLDQRARYVAELAADISHEFKSPLAGIRGAAELLAEGAADDPEARQRFLDNILVDAHRLDRLVSRLLELSRAEANDAVSAVFDYEALVREVAERVAAKMGEAQTEIVVLYRAHRTQVVAKRVLLTSVLTNLLENAVQHARPSTSVEVRVSEVNGGIVTAVQNQGSVISEANLGRIWDRFFTTRAHSGGTGLGLPIVKTIVEAHGGQVAVRSSEGEGTVVSFELPG